MVSPPERVLDAWEAEAAEPLVGGQGVAYRAGSLVLKPVDDARRFVSLADALSELHTDPGMRVSRPVLSRSGTWVEEGWGAWEWLEGSDQVLGCRALLQVSDRFHRAVAEVPASAVRPGRARWSVADRAAWGDEAFPVPSSLAALAARRRVLDARPQLVHSDLAGNVVWHDELGPGVIDLSPYWRPAAYADAIVIADSIAHRGAETDVLEEHLRKHGDQLMIRAVLFRVLAAPSELEAYRPAMEWLLS